MFYDFSFVYFRKQNLQNENWNFIIKTDNDRVPVDILPPPPQ